MRVVVRFFFKGGWLPLAIFAIIYGCSYPGAANPESYSSGWVPPWAYWPTPLEALVHSVVVVLGLVALGMVIIFIGLLIFGFCRLRDWAYYNEKAPD